MHCEVEGFMPTRTLTYTDGCDNDRIYTFDTAFVAFNSSGSDGIHYEDNYPYRYISWRELKKFLEFNNSITNHGGGNENSGFEESSLVNCNDKIFEKIGFAPYLVAPPGGKDRDAFEQVVLDKDFFYYTRTTSGVGASLQNITKENLTAKRGLFGR